MSVYKVNGKETYLALREQGAHVYPSGAVEGAVSIHITGTQPSVTLIGADPDELIEAIERAVGREPRDEKPYPTSIQDLWDNAVIVDEIPANEPAIVRYSDGSLMVLEHGYARPIRRLDGLTEYRQLFPVPAKGESPEAKELARELSELDDPDYPLSYEEIAKALTEAGWKKAA